jgi:hypothetical protein
VGCVGGGEEWSGMCANKQCREKGEKANYNNHENNLGYSQSFSPKLQIVNFFAYSIFHKILWGSPLLGNNLKMFIF